MTDLFHTAAFRYHLTTLGLLGSSIFYPTKHAGVLVAGENSSISVTCACGKKLSAMVTTGGSKTYCTGCGALYELGAPVASNTGLETITPVPANASPPGGEIQGSPHILSYQTPPPSNAAFAKSRWRIAGKTTKRVTCGKCGSVFRYEAIRTARSWSVTTVVAIVGLGLMVGISCLFPMVLIGAGPILLLGSRIWLRLGIGVARSFSGGIDSMKQGGDFASANRRLRRELDKAVEPVPCPQCGWYQPEMVWEARARVFGGLNWMAIALLVLASVFYFSPWQLQLMSGISILGFDGKDPFVSVVMVAVVTMVAILMVLGARWLLALSEDPNRGFPNPRAPYPDSPSPVTEAEWTQKMAAQTSRITQARQPRIANAVSGPRRIVPPKMP